MEEEERRCREIGLTGRGRVRARVYVDLNRHGGDQERIMSHSLHFQNTLHVSMKTDTALDFLVGFFSCSNSRGIILLFQSKSLQACSTVVTMKPMFVGNFGFDTRQSELERLFAKYGRVDRIDMKSGFAFVYFEDERDAEDAIRNLDNAPFGYDRRRLSVEWARGERGRHRDGSKSMANRRPTKTLFVINFDPNCTRDRDIEGHFEPYGKVLNVRIRRNFAFVQFETQEEATKALECTHMSKILDRVVSVEYALRDDDERGGPYDGSPRRTAYGRPGDSPHRRSPSPALRRRPSPDYGRARSPAYDRYTAPYERRRSPDYGRNRSPEVRPDYGRNRSPEYGRVRSRSPIRRSRS